MNHWLHDATSASNYAKFGWPTVDIRATAKRSYVERQKEYEDKLKAFLRCISKTKPIDIPDIAIKAGVIEGTAKKYVSVLFKRRLLDRKKIGVTFHYWRITKSN